MANRSKSGRAYMAAVNGEWAIEPTWIPRILEIAAREHGGLKAVEAERGVALEYTYNVTVRDGVAIIPITGPIFRYASFFTYYSGGTSVGLLARDFNSALNDPRVHSILFEVNSPGGEVTGINELARMIFAARGKKPMTARVGGMCCSAAYWIAAACGDIVIDETAQLGSIGVYASFLDSKNADAKNGFREIRIISDDSPDKCPDPATPAGEKLIKTRLNAICNVFVESVAMFRDVTPERVRADFGKGDVRVGEAAIESGLADRFGSLEETIAELAAAHGPARGGSYTGALHDGTGEASSHVAGESLKDDVLAEGGEPENVDEDEPENVDEQKGTTSTCPDHPDGCPDGEPCEKAAADDQNLNSAHAPVTQLKEGTTEMSTPAENPPGAASASQPTIEQLQAQIAALTARNEQSDAAARASSDRVAKLEAEALTGRLKGMASSFTGDIGAKVTFMEKLAASFGEDSDELKGYVADQTALAAQVKAGGLFGETGTSAGAQSGDTALGKLNAAAAKIASENKVTPEKAFTMACEANPTLYGQYCDEQQ